MSRNLLFVVELAILLNTVLAVSGVAAQAGPAWNVACAEEYVVKPGDWLSKIAARAYGDPTLYSAIAAATNLKAEADKSFTPIANPDFIRGGAKVCLVDQTATLGQGLVVAASDAPGFTEQKVVFGKGLVGTLTRPRTEGKVPAVLMLHGFGSQKDEVGDMYRRLAAGLADRDIASLRIDFRGWGESAGYMVNSTVEGQVADAQTAYTYLAGLDFVDPERIGLLGFSLGGADAIIAAGQHPSNYKSMVTWSSVGNLKDDLLGSLGQQNFDKAAREGLVEIDLGWRAVTLGNAFFRSLELYDLRELIKAYPGAFLAIAGSEDFSAAYVDDFVANARGEPKEAWIVTGGDHIYGVLGEDQTMADSVIDRTGQWFSQTL